MTPNAVLTGTTITLAAVITLAIAAGVLILIIRARREIRAAERSARYRLAAAQSHAPALATAAARVRPSAPLRALSGRSACRDN
jgi:hypothetical protein